MVNVISVEKLKVNNYVGYTSWPHSLFDGETLQTFVIADLTRGILTIDMKNLLVKPNINAARTAIMNLIINYNEAKDQEITLELAHRRLGHILMPQIKRLLNDKSIGMKLSSQDMHICDDCKRGQMRAKSFSEQPILVRSLRPFDLVHTDLLEGFMRALGEQYKWLLIIIDDYTRFA
jgi:hypothetical protein